MDRQSQEAASDRAQSGPPATNRILHRIRMTYKDERAHCSLALDFGLRKTIGGQDRTATDVLPLHDVCATGCAASLLRSYWNLVSHCCCIHSPWTCVGRLRLRVLTVLALFCLCGLGMSLIFYPGARFGARATGRSASTCGIFYSPAKSLFVLFLELLMFCLAK